MRLERRDRAVTALQLDRPTPPAVILGESPLPDIRFPARRRLIASRDNVRKPPLNGLTHLFRRLLQPKSPPIMVQRFLTSIASNPPQPPIRYSPMNDIRVVPRVAPLRWCAMRYVRSARRRLTVRPLRTVSAVSFR